MTDLRKAAERALDALEDIFGKEKKDVGAINALRQALAQPVDNVYISEERVDETDNFNHITVVCHKDHDRGYEDYVGKCLLCEVERLQKREWVGLTHGERFLNDCRTPEEIEYAIAIEQALKEKNG